MGEIGSKGTSSELDLAIFLLNCLIEGTVGVCAPQSGLYGKILWV